MSPGGHSALVLPRMQPDMVPRGGSWEGDGGARLPRPGSYRRAALRECSGNFGANETGADDNSRLSICLLQRGHEGVCVLDVPEILQRLPPWNIIKSNRLMGRVDMRTNSSGTNLPEATDTGASETVPKLLILRGQSNLRPQTTVSMWPHTTNGEARSRAQTFAPVARINLS